MSSDAEVHVMSTSLPRQLLWVLCVLPLGASALPTVSSTQAFTENIGTNPYLDSGWFLGLGATNVVPAGAVTTVQAVHVPADASQNYAIAATPSPVFPNAYIAYVPYTGQSGLWDIVATDGTGSGRATTHLLDDIRQLPLLTGLAAGGDALRPTVTWDRLDPVLYPSVCTSCAVGFDFFNYGVVVRSTSGVLLAQSPTIPNTSPTPSWTLPAGLLQVDQTYLIGFRLNQSELERINSDGSFFSPLENRSSAYLVYTTPVPEPASGLMWLTGVMTLIATGRRRGRALPPALSNRMSTALAPL
jgi:hypothetical protein